MQFTIFWILVVTLFIKIMIVVIFSWGVCEHEVPDARRHSHPWGHLQSYGERHREESWGKKSAICERQLADVAAILKLWAPAANVTPFLNLWAPLFCSDFKFVRAGGPMWRPFWICERRGPDLAAVLNLWSPVGWCDSDLFKIPIGFRPPF